MITNYSLLNYLGSAAHKGTLQKSSPVGQAVNRLPRGVTVVEVLFAMMVALVGLVGVLAIVPLASRQARDSYTLTQSTSTALSASAEMKATHAIQPTTEKPWCFDEDDSNAANSPPAASFDLPLYGTAAYKPVTSIAKMYEGLFRKANERLTNGGTPVSPVVIYRQIVGQGFCFDPLYFASVNAYESGVARLPVYNKANQIIHRTSFPFVSERFDLQATGGRFFSALNSAPAGLNPNANPATTMSPHARLLRVSSWSDTFLAPVRNALAEQIVGGLGDLVQATIQEDDSFGAIREYQGVDNGLLIASAPKTDLTWLATLVPNESISDIPPTNFTLSIVVMSKRDRGFFLPADLTLAGVDELPEFERVAMCAAPDSAVVRTPGVMPTTYPPTAASHLPFSNGGVMTIEMLGDDRASSKLRIGDSIMLSRTLRFNLPDTFAPQNNGPRFVYRHRWFRVIGLDDSETWPRLVTLQGPAWNYPELPATPTAAQLYEARTIATILPHVVAVYEIPISLSETL